MNYQIEGNRAYIKFIKKYLEKNNIKKADENQTDNYYITSSRISGKYCIEFRNFKGVDFFNKLETTKKLQDCDYYPPSLIVKKERDWNILELEDDMYYYCKPKYGSQSKNISVCVGKEFVINQKLEYPFIVQDEIDSKLDNGRKVDYRVFVLYVKKDNKISAYYSPNLLRRVCVDTVESRSPKSFFSFGDDSSKSIVENKGNELFECLKDAQKYIIPKFNSTNYSEIEYFITGYDVIEDQYNKFWIMEINWDPNFFHYDCEKKFHKKIFEDIINHIQKKEFSYFLPLEK
jgi:hypothetical protein